VVIAAKVDWDINAAPALFRWTRCKHPGVCARN
jgi:hypothetical protein